MREYRLPRLPALLLVPSTAIFWKSFAVSSAASCPVGTAWSLPRRLSGRLSASWI